MSAKTIIITAGHSNKDPGATNGKITEAAIVTEFRNMVAYYLLAAKAEYKADGKGPDNLPLAQAIKLITPDSIAVEFHCNASSNHMATGVETLGGPETRELGADLCAAICAVLGLRNRGAKAENAGQHSRLGFVRAGGLIVELFFISNAADLAVYQAKKWLVAKAVAGVLMSHAGHGAGGAAHENG